MAASTNSRARVKSRHRTMNKTRRISKQSEQTIEALLEGIYPQVDRDELERIRLGVADFKKCHARQVWFPNWKGNRGKADIVVLTRKDNAIFTVNIEVKHQDSGGSVEDKLAACLFCTFWENGPNTNGMAVLLTGTHWLTDTAAIGAVEFIRKRSETISFVTGRKFIISHINEEIGGIGPLKKLLHIRK